MASSSIPSLLLLSLLIGVVAGGHHDVVTPDILHHVSKVLSHEYGGKVLLSYPQKAHLVDYGHSVHVDPHPHFSHHYGSHYSLVPQYHHHHQQHHVYPHHHHHEVAAIPSSEFSGGGYGHGFGGGYHHYPRGYY